MDFEDVLKKKYKPYKKQAVQIYYPNNGYRQRSYSKQERFNPLLLLSSLKSNRKLKIIIVVILFVIIAIIIGLLAILYPLISSTLDYVTQNGLSGLFDEAMTSLDKIWNGSK